jgi:hypothetical protein
LSSISIDSRTALWLSAAHARATRAPPRSGFRAAPNLASTPRSIDFVIVRKAKRGT